MKFTSPVYATVSGSIAGLTYARNRGGLYSRARAVPVNPNTPDQVLVKTNFDELIDAWSNVLTPTQRAQWNTWAANVPTTDSLGQQLFLTGQNAYLRGNGVRLRAGFTRQDFGPTVMANATLAPVSVSIVAATGIATITFTPVSNWDDTPDAGIVVQISRPVSPAVTYFKGPFRFLDTVPGVAMGGVTSPQNLDPSPFPLSAGQKVFFRVRLALFDGRVSFPQVVSAIAS